MRKSYPSDLTNDDLERRRGEILSISAPLLADVTGIDSELLIT